MESLTSNDLLYEEHLLLNQFSPSLWLQYLNSQPYKLWQSYLQSHLQFTLNLPISHSHYESLNNIFERALITMHKFPRIWILYLKSLSHQKLVSRGRRVFDRALSALPITQHERIWEIYLKFVRIPIETVIRVYKRYLKFDPSYVEDFIEFLKKSELWQEAAERLARIVDDDEFVSVKGKTKYELWLELCEIVTRNASEVTGLNVEGIIRGGIRKFGNEIGIFEKARSVFEEGMENVVTVRDFSVVFDSYSQFEESALATKMQTLDDDDDESGDDQDEENLGKVTLRGFWLDDDKDEVDLRIARLENLMDRRPLLANSVVLRQNPHNVEQWHKRAKLFEDNPTEQLYTYTQAVTTVDPMKAVGKPHTLWVAFAKLYEEHNDVANARIIFEKAIQVGYKSLDNLASVWCEWAEMELRQKNMQGALDLMKRATAEPAVENKQKFAALGDEPVQMKLHKSLRLWAFYVDLEESLGTLESTRVVYERILDLKIATPQIIINYALLLEENKYFEDAFKVYEKGVNIFKYPHVKDIWVTYLSKFVKRYGKSKLERARELFENAIQQTPANDVKPLYLQYAKFEEDFGLAKRAMKVYDEATKSVPDNEKMSMFEVYILRAAEIFGVPKTREIYEKAIESGLPNKDAKTMCLKYAELEKSLGEIDRTRAVYIYLSQFADPRSDIDFWSKWHEFEIQHGNEDTFREMLRIKRSVSASYSQMHFVQAEHLMQKDQKVSVEATMDTVKRAGVPEDEMAALERQFAPPTANDGARKLGFVSAGVESQGTLKVNHEDIDLPDGSDTEDDENVDIAQKDVPTAVYGGLMNKIWERDGKIGALERLKRQKIC
ncbi:hypothetical protein ACHQM5_023263 [Ranunculus cassubicifolius]